MSSAESNPLTVIAKAAPQLAAVDAARVAREHWGLEASCTELVSERDQNFRLQTADGRRYVLKIANSAEDPVVTDFQVRALLHIERYLAIRAAPISAPQIVRDLAHQTQVMLQIDGVQHVARIVSYLEGVPLADICINGTLCRNLGVFLAHLGLALEDFAHPGSKHALLWDMQQALNLRELLSDIADKEVRGRVAQSLDDFEHLALPRLPSLRAQVIHNDFNPENVLIEAGNATAVAGIIDFGDMLHAPLIVDVAVAASYLRVLDGNPLAQIAEFLAGYHAVNRLAAAEIDILFELIQARLCTTIAILCWRASTKGANDPYLQNAAAVESSADEFLRRLMEIPPENARRIFREVCASVDTGARGNH